MLKALELAGFKSFADKTRFEFPAGVTVVVGPNGSGKSNIVDAIKWVLGEQSAKSLRGKDMSDVIFKGSSGSDARRPANSATATIILDNTDRRFAFDQDEVHVSRRVYRSGETEYLINHETSRLKDIKSLFRGTGVGTDAYSLIEQGKVERMLQTSPKERRAIFEEAAGISRFKANKVEAQRRLARVDGNLIRLADIVDEVGNRYRSVKAQASKAARYKEYSDRLQHLRTSVGMKDWRSLTEKLTQVETESKQQQTKTAELSTEITQMDTRLKEISDQLEQISSRLLKHQDTAASIREQTSDAEASVKLNQSRQNDLNDRSAQLTEQVERSTGRLAELEKRITDVEKDTEPAEIEFRDHSEQLKQLESELSEVDQFLSNSANQTQQRRSQHSDLMNLIAQVGRAVSTADSQLEVCVGEKTRYTNEVDQLSTALTNHRNSYQAYEKEKTRLQAEAESRDSALADGRKTFDQYKSERLTCQQELAEFKTRQAGLTQRAEVIEELEKSLEGINAGARELLQLAQSDSTGKFSEVVGLVADVVAVNVQHAALVDVALGELSQYVIVDGDRLINALADESMKVNGRLGLIQLDSPVDTSADLQANLNGESGVIGRADRLVQVKPQYVDFIRKLLGGTWIVKTLSVALHLNSTHNHGKSVRFVTLDGEVVEADGTVVVGPKSASIGLVSRRSELRALRRELVRLEEQIEQAQAKSQKLEQDVKTSEANVQRMIDENSELASQLADQSMKANAASEQIVETETRIQHAKAALADAQAKSEQLSLQLTSDRENLVAQETQVGLISQLLADDETQVQTSQQRRKEIEQQLTTSKVKLAKREQQLADLHSRVAQWRSELEDQQKTAAQLEQQKTNDATALEQALEIVKTATESIAKLNLQREETADHVQRLTTERDEIDDERRKLAMELSSKRDALRTAQDQTHQATLRIEQLSMQRNQLAERLQDDYGIDVADAEAEIQLTEEELQQRDQVDQEISQLRKQISDIGSVNLESLEELEDLEGRYTQMESQYQDLVQSKETLEKIITRIDSDSRKLFVETLEAIRQNFQKLFRQTFGGGHADIILEEGVDPLEAGVEIIATPPGKPEFNNSLLSGGEKALTAVSLLMAIFQFRPSPFCVLDEVDAPFDEANIGRFIDVLKSFLGWTKFVIVTHSKKTMTSATTLYGITMQESGVSKRVSVRFEDVSEDGHISEEAINRGESEDAA